MSDAPQQPRQPSLADRLRNVHVGVRKDLDVSRHVFRHEPAYVVRDPITFQSHRFSPEDYHLLLSIDAGRTLGEIFDELVAQGRADRDDEEKFYQFIFHLHRLGFLNLPVSDDKLLYRRYQAKRQARIRQRLMGFLFLQVPLVNPDAFLSRTMPLMRWAFTRTFFVIWLVLVGSAAYVAASNADALIQPLDGLLATRNLVVMWLTLIILKVFHEFGHAYACKNFGGHVPEMGAYLIAFTPCAYVDATAVWGFPRKLHRLIVSLAGVYFELTIAAVAVFVWASTQQSLIHSIAYNVIFLASTVTVLFNINPLMRYDGYYIASDLLEIPNLRQRAKEYVLLVLKHRLLGVPPAKRPAGRRLRFILLSFGLCTVVYRTLVFAGIATMLSLKFALVGLAMACFFLSSLAFALVKRLARYLWFAQETAPVRGRAVALSVVVFFLIPLVAGLVPLPQRVRAAGVVAAEKEVVVRAAVPGFVERVTFKPGESTRPGEPLAELSNTALDEQMAQAQAELQACEIRRRALESTDPAAAAEQAEQARYLRAQLEHMRSQRGDLRVTAPTAGRVVDGLKPTDTGRFVRAGEAVAHLISGHWEVRVLLTSDEFTAAAPRIGEAVTFRPCGLADRTFRGRITRIDPAGSRQVDLAALTHIAGGDVLVEPQTGQALQPYFELVIRLDEGTTATGLRHGLTGAVQLPARPEPLLPRVYRRIVRFIHKLERS